MANFFQLILSRIKQFFGRSSEAANMELLNGSSQASAVDNRLSEFRVQIQDSDSVLLEIGDPKSFKLDAYQLENFKSNTNGVNIIDSFQPVVNLAKDVATARKVVIMANPDLLKKINQGEAFWQRAKGGGFRANIVDAEGKIIGQGKFSHAISPVQVVGAVWNTLALITGQKFLADISAKLTSIQNKVNAIYEFLEDTQVARLQGAMRYMQSVYSTIDKGLIQDKHQISVYHNQLEGITRDLMELDDLFKRNIVKADQLIKSENQKDWTLKGSSEKRLNEHLETSFKSIKIIDGCIQAQMLANYLICALPIDKQIAYERLERLEQDHIKSIAALNSFVASANNALHLSDNPYMGFRSTYDERKERLAKGILIREQDSNSLFKQSDVLIRVCKEKIMEMHKQEKVPQYFQLQLNEEYEIIDAKHLVVN